MKASLLIVITLLFCWAGEPVFAQRAVEPNDLKISPNKYKNASIILKDVFINRRSGVPPALTAAGYTTQKYISFGCRESGMWCFLRRTSANETLVGGLKDGERITVYGTVRQPKAKVKRAGGRVTDSYKLDIYLIEASKVESGWGGDG